MAGRTPPEAVQNFLDPLQKSLSCLTRTVVNVRGGYYAPRPHALVLGDSSSTRLLSNPAGYLSVFQNYRVVEDEGDRGPWKVSIVSYLYSLGDEDGHEIG